MRQYKKLRMFIHAEDGETGNLAEQDLVAFIRMGNDFTQNYYQIEIPLEPSNASATRRDVWPLANEINLELSILEQIKSIGINDATLANEDPSFYDVIDGVLNPTVLTDPNSGYNQENLQRVSIKGNPNFGDVRVLMLGLKNPGVTGTKSYVEKFGLMNYA